MAYWLLKSEPESYSWADLVRDGKTEWDGVRNHAAAGHLRAMTIGDRALLYHSGTEKAAIGICAISRAARREGDDGNWVSVEVKPVEPLSQPVSLATMRGAPQLAGMAMLRQSRLSVSPVGEAEWAAVLGLGGVPTRSAVPEHNA